MLTAVRTHPGRVLTVNQDACLVRPGQFPLYAVADGMGGHIGGEVASALALSTLSGLLKGAPEEGKLRAAVDAANRAVFDKGNEVPELRGMGTTLTCLWEGRRDFFMAHIGDSRCYLSRGGVLYRQSVDHSVVGDLVRRGLLTAKEAANYPYRNVITRALGPQYRVQADVLRWDKRPGDRLLLCSDGLTEYVKDDALSHLVPTLVPEALADLLMQLALDGGGRDNITVLVGEVTA